MDLKLRCQINSAELLDETQMNGQFRPRMWNYYAHSGPRTNSHLEGWHAQQKEENCKKGTPNLYKVLELFQREQAVTEVTIQQLEAGGVRKAKRRKVVQWEETIKSLQHELTTGERILDSFISAIRHCVVAFDF